MSEQQDVLPELDDGLLRGRWCINEKGELLSPGGYRSGDGKFGQGDDRETKKNRSLVRVDHRNATDKGREHVELVRIGQPVESKLEKELREVGSNGIWGGYGRSGRCTVLLAFAGGFVLVLVLVLVLVTSHLPCRRRGCVSQTGRAMLAREELQNVNDWYLHVRERRQALVEMG